MSTSVQMQAVAGGGKICFRGDDRQPAAMFRDGFHSREDGSITYKKANPAPLLINKDHVSEYERGGFKTTVGKTFDPTGMTPSEIYARTLDGKSPKGMHIAIVPRTADIKSSSAVCISPRFATAILFPPKERASDQKEFTWVYAVWVTELFNTHAQQVADGMRAIENELAVRSKISHSSTPAFGGTAIKDAHADNVALWPLYAQELATKTIEPRNIICAIRVRRTWKGPDFTHGCDYELLKRTLRFNRLCSVDKSQVKAVKAFMKAEPVKGTTPSRSSGFHKDDENSRISISIGKLAARVDEFMKGHSAHVEDQSDVDDSEWV